MKYLRYVLLLVSITAIYSNDAVACTTFCFMNDGEWVYGRNYDWSTEHCLVMVNKRGVVKNALTQDNPASWVSKYGSITFNQYGREFPLGGMNEAGLVIEVMWLEQTEYPHPDSRRGLSDLQWVQYQLDNCSTVDEVVASDGDVRITPRNATPLHFLVCDRTGRAAAIEFLEGKMVAHTGNELPVSALTNSTYAHSLSLYKAFDGDQNREAFAAADYSLKRFVWAGQGLKNWNPLAGDSPVDYAFGILEKVAVDFTQFRIVYDTGNGRIYYCCQSNEDIRYVDVNEFDYSCSKPVKVLDIVAGEAGNVTGIFSDYTYEANYDLINKAYSGTDFLKEVPATVREKVARYPEGMTCNQ
ncbi:MAG: linear amide C-N hydrolase [candidate division WOR-3 bacterium]|nr:MAG: linear amide C-N hydrolase [candidate division WOR-3 bacterium]